MNEEQKNLQTEYFLFKEVQQTTIGVTRQAHESVKFLFECLDKGVITQAQFEKFLYSVCKNCVKTMYSRDEMLIEKYTVFSIIYFQEKRIMERQENGTN